MNKKSVLSLIAMLLTLTFGYAEQPKDSKSTKSVKRTLMEGCAPATSQADLNINNVRARILGSGDMWWDLNQAQYEVPKGSNRHSMFAGALWLGGIDEADNLRLAAMTYRQDGVDYWPGPLIDNSASVTAETCERYNRHWIVYREDVELHKEWVECKLDPNCNIGDRFPGYGGAAVPEVIRLWPGNGLDGELPNKLAPYFETSQGTPGLYEWEYDYPGYDIDGTEDCRLKETDLLYGDQTIWWVYNDKGNTHTETQAAALGFEVRAQAFAFTSNDEVNNMTFNNYRIINKSTFRLTNTYFGTWFDADLGNAFDDIIGSDIARGLGYVYNGDSDDDGARGYGLNPPAIGFDFFQGPFADYFDGLDNDRDGCIDGVRNSSGVCEGENPAAGLNERIIMSGFMYYNNSSGFTGPQAMTDPDNGQEFYNYLRSRWRNGNTLFIESPSGKGNTNNGDGFVGNNAGTDPTLFAYPGLSYDTTGSFPPFAPVDWWESPSNLADKRGLHCAGPFSLAPGALNFITTGAVWARNFRSNDLFASVNDVIIADDKAQQLFDNCFNVLDGPRSPNLEIIELDRQLVLNLKNAFTDKTIGYEEIDPAIPPQPNWGPSSIDSARQAGYFSYIFEGFQIFQVAGPDVGIENIYDQSQARLIFQCDAQNNLSQLVNFEVDPELDNNALVPQDMTLIANNKGIELSFSVTEDAFAEGDQRMVNNREYYFYVLAYSQNDYITTDPRDLGKNSQKRPYLAGRNIGNNQKPYLGIPNALNSYVTNSEWGEGLQITRYAGGGNSGNYERLTDGTRDSIATQGKIAAVKYQPGAGPIDVKVVDPRSVVPGDFRVQFDGTEDDSGWILIDDETGEVIDSSRFGLSFLGEQIIDGYGISIATRNVIAPGLDTNQVRNNGFIGADISYDDPSQPWLSGVPDDGTTSPLNWILSGNADNPDEPEASYNAKLEKGFLPDPFGVFETILAGSFGPSGLLSDVSSANTVGYGVSPGLIPVLRPKIADLPNIDIVITKDHTKWTRVPVIELGDDPNANEGMTDKFQLRSDPSMDLVGSQLQPSTTTTGWSYFPGYAVNTQTGRRLQMAFGENSWLKSENGGDMLWNPSPNIFRKLGTFGLGGMHMIYVFADSVDLFAGVIDLTYDPAVQQNDPSTHPLFGRFNNPSDIFSSMAWAGFPLVSSPAFIYFDYADIPTDVRIEVRMDRPFKKTKGSDLNGGNPVYGFSTKGSSPDEFTPDLVNSALDLIRVVPNPYYGGSEYEGSQLENIVKITNLPFECSVNIFMTNGTLVRTINKSNDLTFIEWDLTNNFGVPVSSGIYLIHIDAGEGGQKVVKWMGAMRPVDLNAF